VFDGDRLSVHHIARQILDDRFRLPARKHYGYAQHIFSVRTFPGQSYLSMAAIASRFSRAFRPSVPHAFAKKYPQQCNVFFMSAAAVAGR